MSVVKRVSKNIASLVTIEIINQLSLLILAIIIPRYLGDAGFGKYSFIISFTILFSIFLDLGLRSLTIREVSRGEDTTEKYFSNIATIKVILSLITFAAIFTIANIMDYSRDTQIALYLMSFSLILNSFSDIFRSIFYAFQKMEYGALSISIGKIITTLLACVFLFFGYGIVEVMLAYCIGNIFALLLNYTIYIKNFPKPKFSIDLKFCKQLIKMATPFGLAIAFNNVFFNFDIVMISHTIGDAATGWYSIPTIGDAATGWYSIPRYILSVLITFFYTISFAIFPTFSKFYSSSEELLKHSYKKTFKYLLILILPIPFVICILSNKIIIFLFGHEFVNSVFILKVLIWLLIPISLSRFLEVILASINRQEIVTYTLGICALLNIVLDIVLIPILGYTGAIVATMVAQTSVFVIDLYFVHRYLCKPPVHKFILKPLVACIMIGTFVYYLQDINLFMLVFAALILYYILLTCMKGFDKEDLELFKRLIKRGE
jgi:O-antigen/teichoic acid export membrane protein